MELGVLIIAVISIGLIVRYSMPGRGEHGMLLVPTIAFATGVGSWCVGLLLGFGGDDFLLWLIAFVLAAVASFLVAKFLPARRITQHEERVQRYLAG